MLTYIQNPTKEGSCTRCRGHFPCQFMTGFTSNCLSCKVGKKGCSLIAHMPNKTADILLACSLANLLNSREYPEDDDTEYPHITPVVPVDNTLRVQQDPKRKVTPLEDDSLKSASAVAFPPEIDPSLLPPSIPRPTARPMPRPTSSQSRDVVMTEPDIVVEADIDSGPIASSSSAPASNARQRRVSPDIQGKRLQRSV